MGFPSAPRGVDRLAARNLQRLDYEPETAAMRTRDG